MNQILVTEKIYVTPELKRKKKLYKFNFFLSVFLVCVLFSYYIYAEYDRNTLALKYILPDKMKEQIIQKKLILQNLH